MIIEILTLIFNGFAGGLGGAISGYLVNKHLLRLR